MKVLVVGATGGSGRAVVQWLLADGHDVTAFARHADGLPAAPRLRTVNGDAMDAAAVEQAVRGHDAVVVTLGISENAIRVRLLGTGRTPLDIRSAGTLNVITAMQRASVRKLVVQSSYGVGPTRDRLRLVDRLFFGLVLKPQIADTEKQELAVRASGLDWVVAQPVHLTDADDDTPPAVSTTGDTMRSKVSRRGVGRLLADAATSDAYDGKTLALSGAA